MKIKIEVKKIGSLQDHNSIVVNPSIATIQFRLVIERPSKV